jgi:hypothetical protein
MSAAKRARPAPEPGRSRPPRSAKSIAHAAVAHEGRAMPGDRVELTLGITLSRAQADRLTARAIAEGKNLDALVSEILEAAPTGPPAW